MNDYPGEKRPIHLLQSALLSTLLRKDMRRKWRSLVAAWARWLFDEYPWLEDNFSFESWLSYVYNILSGARPFPWPQEFTIQESIEANLSLFQATVAWIARDEPERVAIALGLTDIYGAEAAEPTVRSILQRLAKVTAEAGDVAEAIDAAIDERSERGREISPKEAMTILSEIDEQAAALATLKATVSKLTEADHG